MGERWRQRLHERLRWADAVVCVVTSAAVASSWCAAEIATAHRVFFGRADEIKQLSELVRSAAGGAALLVVGPSGCGKSSLAAPGWCRSS
ncbi:MAG: toll/interleukin-1 receptor domain-containing protein [Actinomycetota bacterium]|nr:toll/interleukin-1 receptor domain-containing protein [Actinomycetota bacterium]